jgi:hypothetical protein
VGFCLSAFAYLHSKSSHNTHQKILPLGLRSVSVWYLTTDSCGEIFARICSKTGSEAPAFTTLDENSPKHFKASHSTDRNILLPTSNLLCMTCLHAKIFSLSIYNVRNFILQTLTFWFPSQVLPCPFRKALGIQTPG